MNRRSALTFATAASAGLAVTRGSSASAAEVAATSSARTRAAATASATSASPIAHTHRTSFIERTDGTALFYKDWGVGKPVLFVHSAGINSDMWAYQMVPFVRQGLRCVAFDRRGHGRSSDPGRGYDYDTLADDLAAVMDVLDLRNVTLVGHSMGCAEIIRYLTRHGAERVSRVALLAPTLPFFLKTPDNPEGIDKSVFEALRATFARDYPKWLADNAPAFFTPETSPAMMQWGIDMMLRTSLQAAIQCNVAVSETDFRAELRRIKAPTLIVHGTKDVSAPLPLTGARTAKLIPDCELAVYEGAPHGLFITHMERLNAQLLHFIGA